MSEYLDLFQNPEFWRLLLEMVVIPLLLSGEEFGLIRLLNWFKGVTNLSGKMIAGFPVMKAVAGIAAALAALAVSFVDGAFTGVVPEPPIVIGIAVAFFTLTQSWYAKIAGQVSLENVKAQLRGGDFH